MRGPVAGWALERRGHQIASRALRAEPRDGSSRGSAMRKLRVAHSSGGTGGTGSVGLGVSSPTSTTGSGVGSSVDELARP